jgi:hypothetical protein
VTLITPYAFDYDLAALAAVPVWMLSGRLPRRPEWSVLYLFGWITPVALVYADMFGLAVAPLVLILMFAASLVEAAGAPAAARWARPEAPDARPIVLTRGPPADPSRGPRQID